MEPPHYLRIDQVRTLLAEMGIDLSERQIKRAADPDPNGKRKLPFFVDPIDGRLKIEKGTLVRIYREAQIDAENNSKI